MKNIEKTILRKTLIYKTEVEYGDYTINHIQGCSHGCLYPCYAFMMAKRFGKVKNYEEWLEPCLVSNALELLNKEIPRFINKISSLHLCFSTDPFMFEYDEISKMSIEIVRCINTNGIKCTCLTKGILPSELASLSSENEYGISLISLSETFRQEMEPFSAPYIQRIGSLRRLHDAGCKTWVSIEPYPTPNIIEQDLSEILSAVSFADKIIFGRLNYSKRVTEYKDYKSYYNNLAKQVIDFCSDNDIAYHIKDGTLTEIQEEPQNEQ